MTDPNAPKAIDAVERVRRYLAMRDAKPMRNLGDVIHGVHARTEWEADLRLSDLRVLESAIRAEERERCLAAVENEALTAPSDSEGDASYDSAIQHAAEAIRALPSDAPPPPTYRHVKRGTCYRVIGAAELQCATGSALATQAVEGMTLAIYRGDDGKLWARPEDEFHDGRFELVSDEVKP